MTTEKQTRRKYTEEFMRDAVALATEQEYKEPEAARSLCIGDNYPDTEGLLPISEILY